jgi:hypothetical protein
MCSRNRGGGGWRANGKRTPNLAVRLGVARTRTEEAAMKLCALCGEVISEDPADPEDAETAEYVPALQFIPKSMRPGLRGALWKVPSHKRCNQAEKLDEE